MFTVHLDLDCQTVRSCVVGPLVSVSLTLGLC